nr:uncharacterized protein LOC127340016 [Lolium perenne]
MSPGRTGEALQAVELPESIRGRRWADVADEVDAEEAARAELVARCSPPGTATLGDYLVYARRGHPRRSPPQRRSVVGRGPRRPPPPRAPVEPPRLAAPPLPGISPSGASVVVAALEVGVPPRPSRG